jgi:hypothetical protein
MRVFVYFGIVDLAFAGMSLVAGHALGREMRSHFGARVSLVCLALLTALMLVVLQRALPESLAIRLWLTLTVTTLSLGPILWYRRARRSPGSSDSDGGGGSPPAPPPSAARRREERCRSQTRTRQARAYETTTGRGSDTPRSAGDQASDGRSGDHRLPMNLSLRCRRPCGRHPLRRMTSAIAPTSGGPRRDNHRAAMRQSQNRDRGWTEDAAGGTQTGTGGGSVPVDGGRRVWILVPSHFHRGAMRVMVVASAS